MSFAGLVTASASCGDGRSLDHYVYLTPGAPHTAPWFGDNRRRRNPIDCRHCGGHFASVSMLRSQHSKKDPAYTILCSGDAYLFACLFVCVAFTSVTSNTSNRIRANILQ